MDEEVHEITMNFIGVLPNGRHSLPFVKVLFLHTSLLT